MPKNLKDIERSIKALANRRRLAMILYLKREGESSVAEIARGIPLSFKATSKHLLILASVEIVEREQRGLQVFYRLASTLSHPARDIILRL